MNQFNDRRDIAQIEETLRSLTDEQYMHTHIHQNGFWVGIAPTSLFMRAGLAITILLPGARGAGVDGVIYYKMPRTRAAALAMVTGLAFLPAIRNARLGEFTQIDDLADRFYDYGAPTAH
jgi:hypothetical protein